MEKSFQNLAKISLVKMQNQIPDTINELIREKGAVILDGGFSNQLSTYNYDFERSELWTSNVLLDRPDLIKNVHLDYLRAGSDVITTGSLDIKI